MKIKSGFMLREIAGSWVVVPIGQRVVEFNGLMTLSESGALIWKMLEKGADMDDLIKALTREYNIDEPTVIEDLKELMEGIESKGLIEK